MIAVVFWNTRRSDTGAREYRDALVGFHHALNEVKPAGLRYSCTFATDTVPWLRSRSEVYEDWYVIRNFGAIDALDDAVLADDRLGAHTTLMGSTAAASGGVFGLTSGAARIYTLPEAYWITARSERDGERVAAIAADATNRGHSLWTRSLALGPHGTVLLTAKPLQESLPGGAFHRHRTLVWSP